MENLCGVLLIEKWFSWVRLLRRMQATEATLLAEKGHQAQELIRKGTFDFAPLDLLILEEDTLGVMETLRQLQEERASIPLRAAGYLYRLPVQ